MKKLITLMILIHSYTSNYTMEKYIPINEGEKQLDQKITTQTNLFDNWIDTYEIEQIEKRFLKIGKECKLLLKAMIQDFIQKPLRKKYITLTEYTLTNLKNTLENMKVDSFIIQQVIFTLMIESYIYYLMGIGPVKNHHYFCTFIKYLEKLKAELRKPI